MVSQGRPGHPTLLKSRLRALNAARGQPADFAADANNGQETATMGEIQVAGLHTPNPLVMYNGQLLSCHWTSTIGTDMFFVKPDADAASATQPLRSLPAVDLLSLGSAKLVAKVGRLRPRDDVRDSGDAQQATEPAVDAISGQNSAVAALDESERHRPAANEGGSAPSSFLERLNEVKAKRGEPSRLAISKTSDGSRLVAEKADAANDAAMGGV